MAHYKDKLSNFLLRRSNRIPRKRRLLIQVILVLSIFVIQIILNCRKKESAIHSNQRMLKSFLSNFCLVAWKNKRPLWIKQFEQKLSFFFFIILSTKDQYSRLIFYFCFCFCTNLVAITSQNCIRFLILPQRRLILLSFYWVYLYISVKIKMI